MEETYHVKPSILKQMTCKKHGLYPFIHQTILVTIISMLLNTDIYCTYTVTNVYLLILLSYATSSFLILKDIVFYCLCEECLSTTKLWLLLILSFYSWILHGGNMPLLRNYVHILYYNMDAVRSKCFGT